MKLMRSYIETAFKWFPQHVYYNVIRERPSLIAPRQGVSKAFMLLQARITNICANTRVDNDMLYTNETIKIINRYPYIKMYILNGSNVKPNIALLRHMLLGLVTKFT